LEKAGGFDSRVSGMRPRIMGAEVVAQHASLYTCHSFFFKKKNLMRQLLLSFLEDVVVRVLVSVYRILLPLLLLLGSLLTGDEDSC
jgi:hypothetical protein